MRYTAKTLCDGRLVLRAIGHPTVVISAARDHVTYWPIDRQGEDSCEALHRATFDQSVGYTIKPFWIFPREMPPSA